MAETYVRVMTGMQVRVITEAKARVTVWVTHTKTHNKQF